MLMEEFEKKVEKALRDYHGQTCDVRISKIRKNNGIQLTGVSVFKGDSNITPTVYLDEYLKSYENGRSFGTIMSDIINLLEQEQPGRDFNVNDFLIWERAKEHIAYKLVNTGKNEELLREVPSYPFMDMSVVFYYLLGTPAGCNASILIYNKHIEQWGIGAEELYEAAKANTEKLLPATVQNISELLKDVFMEDLKRHCRENDTDCTDMDAAGMADEIMSVMERTHDEVPMYVMTNSTKYFGAASLLYKGALSDFAERMEASFYILPSSVHEIILLIDRGYASTEELSDMVKQVNDTQLSPEEILSDSVYYYDRYTKELSILRSMDMAAYA